MVAGFVSHVPIGKGRADSIHRCSTSASVRRNAGQVRAMRKMDDELDSLDTGIEPAVEIEKELEPSTKVPNDTSRLAMTAAAVTAAAAIIGVASPSYALGMDALQTIGNGFSASFVLILVSEIGDKTFFISALLAMKYSRSIVFLGSVLALGLMTVISVLIGQIFHALPNSLNSNIPFDDYAAVALLLFFGYQNIRDGLSKSDDEEDGELKDAEEYLQEARSGEQKWWRTLTSTGGLRLLLQTFSLVFVAEWGDKSMIATIALAAAKSPFGVVVGGVTGHIVASIIAVLGGSLLGKYISERTARLIGGVLFLVFAVLTLNGIY